MVLDREPAESKLLLSLAAGGAVTIAAGTICWFCGSDLAGGASLSEHSLRAAGTGLAAAAPLAAGRLLFWNDGAAEALPPLSYLQRGKVDAFKPLLSNLTPAQARALSAAAALLAASLCSVVVGVRQRQCSSQSLKQHAEARPLLTGRIITT